MKVNVKGTVVSDDDKWIYDYFEIASTSPADISNAIDSLNGEDVEVEINSGGGDVFAGSEIYTALKGYSGNVTVKIVGLCASIASVIAMAGDKVLMSPTAQLMIHNVSSGASGDYRDMDKASEVLKGANDIIANSYIIKTGKTRAELLAMMDAETWLTPTAALENHFVDEIMFDSKLQLSNSLATANLLPREVIEKVRNEMKSSQQQASDTSLMTAKLNLLKLKGKY